MKFSKSQLRDPFVQPSPLAKRRLLDIVATASKTYANGWNQGTGGNFSVRDSFEIMWQSPSGVAKGSMVPTAFVPISLNDLASVRPISAKPSDETPLHAAIYRRYPTARVIVHVHPPCLVRASLVVESLRFDGSEMSKILGAKSHLDAVLVPIFENTQDMIALGQTFKHLMFSGNFIILRGHGVYAWGSECLDALKIIEGLEFLCQTTH